MWTINNKKLYLIVALTCCVINCDDALATKKKQKVCVIGAGATGLTTAKNLAENADDFDIVVFEKNSDVGGVWIYSDSVTVDEHNLPIHSSMYKRLRTNLPKELMAFPDYRNFTDPEQRSCVTHETVLAYLRNYTDHFNLRQYIQFNTMVDKVTTIPGEGDWRTTKYEIKTTDLNTKETSKTTCDALAVCNGHYFEPRVPKIPGIETFPGKIIHSHFYRIPEDFTGQTVLVLGASSSGVDISIEISEYAKKVYLSHNKDKINSELPANIEQVSGVVSINGSTLILKDGTNITADTFMYCTGYVFAYPFLDESSGISVDDNQVAPLYKHLINIDRPSMSFMGLPLLVVHFPLFHMQAKYFVSVLKGDAVLPDKETMLKDTELNGKLKRYAHFLGPAQWDYNDELAQAGHFEPLPAYYRKGFMLWFAYRNKDVLHYKESNLRVSDSGETQLVHPSKPSKQA